MEKLSTQTNGGNDWWPAWSEKRKKELRAKHKARKKRLFKKLGIDGRTVIATPYRKPRLKKKGWRNKKRTVGARVSPVKRAKPKGERGLTQNEYHMLKKYRSFSAFELDRNTVYSKLSPEDQRYIKNVVLAGLNVKEAIMDAYLTTDSHKISSIARHVQGDRVKSAICEALVGANVTKQFLSSRIKAGLEAKKTFVNKETGELEESAYDDFAAQHKYVETTLKLMGAYSSSPAEEVIDPEDEAEIKEAEDLELESLKSHLDSQK